MCLICSDWMKSQPEAIKKISELHINPQTLALIFRKQHLLIPNLCRSHVLYPALSHTSGKLSFRTKDCKNDILKALKHYYTFLACIIKCSIHTLFPLGPGAPEGPGGPAGPREPGKPGAPAIPAAPYKTSLQINN